MAKNVQKERKPGKIKLKKKLKAKSVKNHKCPLCQKRFDTKEKLRCHIITHDSKTLPSYPCSICGTKWRYYSGLVVHYRTVHPNHEVPGKQEPELQCNFADCDFTATDLLQLRAHSFSVHFSEDYHDQENGETGTKYSTLTGHHTTYGCLLCKDDKFYRSTTTLANHFLDQHQSTANMWTVVTMPSVSTEVYIRRSTKHHVLQTFDVWLKQGGNEHREQFLSCRYDECPSIEKSVFKIRKHAECVHEDFQKAREDWEAKRAGLLNKGNDECGVNGCTYVATHGLLLFHRKRHNVALRQCYICKDVFDASRLHTGHLRKKHNLTKLPHVTPEWIFDDVSGTIAPDESEDEVETENELEEDEISLNGLVESENLVAIELHRWIDKSTPNASVQNCPHPGCTFTTNSKGLYQNHLERHQKDLVYRCRTCSQVFPTELCAQIHAQDFHYVFQDEDRLLEVYKGNPGVIRLPTSNGIRKERRRSILCKKKQFNSIILQRNLSKATPLQKKPRRSSVEFKSYVKERGVGRVYRPKRRQLHHCNICKRFFYRKCYLARHLESAHQNNTGTNEADAAVSAPVVNPQHADSFTCEKFPCQNMYSTYSEYKEHCFTHSETQQPYQRWIETQEKIDTLITCSHGSCEFKGISKMAMTTHETRHYWGYSIQCLICKQLYMDFEKARNHIKKFHRATRNSIVHYKNLEASDNDVDGCLYKCTLDGCTFEAALKLQFSRHIMLHIANDNVLYKCSLCGFRISDYNVLIHHVNDNHPGAAYCIKKVEDSQFGTHNNTCNICKVTFKRYQSYVVHVEFFHPERAQIILSEIYPFAIKLEPVDELESVQTEMEVDEEELPIPKLVLVRH